MDTTRWKDGDEFAVLDLVAQFQFKTSCSLAFHLGKLIKRGIPRPPEMSDLAWELVQEEGAEFFVILGWLDLHHPCEGFHRLQVRVGLPDRYVSWETMRDLVAQVIGTLELPADKSYHIYLTGLSQQTETEEPSSGFVS
jgi:hypothetical protein